MKKKEVKNPSQSLSLLSISSSSSSSFVVDDFQSFFSLNIQMFTTWYIHEINGEIIKKTTTTNNDDDDDMR